MSYDHYSKYAMDGLDSAMQANDTENERIEVAKAQVWATLALAEAVRKGLADLSTR